MGTDIHGKLRYKDWQDKIVEVSIPPYFDGRDYDFFAILANVRNGYGFAGSKRYDKPVEPITNDRGLPKDVDQEDENFWYGDHSFGYVTLEDLLNTELHKQTVVREGWLDEKEYLRMREAGETSPQEWAGGVSGGKIVKVESMNYDIHRPAIEDDQHIYIHYKWEDSPFEEKINKLKDWMSLYLDFRTEPDDIMFVFGFDS